MSKTPRLAAALAAAWEAEVVSARRLSAAAERAPTPADKARLLVLAAFCRAHASRLVARLSTMGRCPLPVPPEDVDVDDDPAIELKSQAHTARHAAARYDTLAESSRAQADVSSAWVCELNRAEEAELAEELEIMALLHRREGEFRHEHPPVPF
ncbi:MAG: hypothetical protein ACJ790_17650 [Myxococcaceae bacterium]